MQVLCGIMGSVCSKGNTVVEVDIKPSESKDSNDQIKHPNVDIIDQKPPESMKFSSSSSLLNFNHIGEPKKEDQVKT